MVGRFGKRHLEQQGGMVDDVLDYFMTMNFPGEK